MNCNQNPDGTARIPGMMPVPGPGPVHVDGNMPGVWETPYPISHGFMQGTIFPSLDYPFMMGGCRKWQR